MTEKNPDKDQTITPAGEVELSEEELDQAAGGWVDKLTPETTVVDTFKVEIEGVTQGVFKK